MTLWRFASLISSLVGARMAGAVFGFLMQLVLARNFPPEAVGIVFLTMSVAALASLVATAGYPSLGLTYLARAHTLSRHRLIAAFFAAARRDTFLLSLAILALAVLAWFIDRDYALALIFGCLAMPAQSIMRLNNVAANSVRRFTLSYLPDFVLRPVLTLLAVIALAWFAPDSGVVYVLWSFVVIMWVVTAGQAVVLGKDGVTGSWSLTAGGRLASLYRRRAAALVTVALATIAFADVVTLLGGLFLPPADVAVLGVAVKLAALTGFVSQASQQFVMRDLTEAITRGTGADTQRLLLRTNVMSLGVMLAALVGSALFGDRVLALFGGDYAGGQWALVILVAGQTLRSASGMNINLLSLGGHQSRIALSCMTAFAIMIAMAAFLAPRYGVLGIAIAALIADAVWAISLGILVRGLTGRAGDIFAVTPGLTAVPGNRHNLAQR